MADRGDREVVCQGMVPGPLAALRVFLEEDGPTWAGLAVESVRRGPRGVHVVLASAADARRCARDWNGLAFRGTPLTFRPAAAAAPAHECTRACANGGPCPLRAQGLAPALPAECLPAARAMTLAFDASVDLPTLYEDEALLVVAKPAGCLCHPSPGHWDAGTVSHAVVGRVPAPMLAERGDHKEKDSFIPKCLVHRLDAGTTGALLLAKTEAAARSLTAQFRDKTAASAATDKGSGLARKTYVVVLRGRLAAAEAAGGLKE